MFAKKSDEKLNDIVREELSNARTYGQFYSSMHEGYAVLKEEIEETKEAVDSFKGLLHVFWLSVRGQKDKINRENYSDKEQMEIMYKRAMHVAKEATQVAAVCLKLKESIEAGVKE